MTITLTSSIERALTAAAQRAGTTPEELAIQTLAEHLLPRQPRDEWERELLRNAVDCGVSLTNEQVSSEGIYE